MGLSYTSNCFPSNRGMKMIFLGDEKYISHQSCLPTTIIWTVSVSPFFILKETVLLLKAVQKLSIVLLNFFSETSSTITLGGGRLPNFLPNIFRNAKIGCCLKSDIDDRLPLQNREKNAKCKLYKSKGSKVRDSLLFLN